MKDLIKAKETFDKLTFLQERIVARMQQIKTCVQYGTAKDTVKELEALTHITDEVIETAHKHFENE